MKRASFIPAVELDRSRLQPLRRQVSSQLAAGIRNGRIPSGAYLPSSRLYALMLRVSRNTIVEAYEELLESGLIETHPRSGIRVRAIVRTTIPDFSTLRSAAREAHYPAQTIPFEDWDGTGLYFNVVR